FGARRTAGYAMLFGAATCGLRAFAHTPAVLAAFMFLFGLHIGFVAPALPKALSAHVPAARFARANGLTVLAYTFGTAITMVTARTWLLPHLGGWRHAMLFSAVAMALAGIAWLAGIRDGFVAAHHATLRSSFTLLRNSAVRRVAAAHFLLFGGYLALLSSLPHLLLEAGVDKTKVGISIAAWLATAGLANFVGPSFSDRMERRKPIILAGAALAALALTAVAFAPPSQKPLFLAVAAIGGGAFAPLLLTIPFELPGVGIARGGAALGLLMMLGQVGGFLLPVLVGGTSEAAGFRAAILTLAMLHALILIPALGLPETGPSGDHSATAWQKNTGDVA
ncbi:MAG: MFS transporter, partial [Polyangiaceae bacterium]